ncbi:MAG TPA: hypothetical protein VGP06_14055 [Janthinobacterium sp.]|nr:hypothetical protein [Janthinobacterium sp.]
MNDRAVVSHRMPGRVRFSIPERRGDSAYFSSLSERFSALDAVTRVRANVLAGSIALEFSGALDDVMRGAGAENLFDMEARATHAADYLLPAHYVQPVSLVTGRELNPSFMAGAAFAALGLLQSFRGQVMVPAATAFWYASSTFQQTGMSAGAVRDDGGSGRSESASG